MKDKELEEFKERVKDYRDVIIYSTNLSERLGIDELLLLLAECIGDKKIEKEVGKYVDDYYKDFEEIREEFKGLYDEIDGLKEQLNKYRFQNFIGEREI